MPPKVGAILITHGHASHLGASFELSQIHRCPVFAVHEVSVFLQDRGLDKVSAIGMNYGGTIDLPRPGWSATLVTSMHSSCVNDNGAMPGGLRPGGGVAGGWVVASPSGSVIYHAGDTEVHAGMRLIDEMWSPSLVILPIGGHYCMSPEQAAYAVNKLMPNTEVVVPWSSCFAAAQWPVRKGRPDELRRRVTRKDVTVMTLAPGATMIVPKPRDTPERRERAWALASPGFWVRLNNLRGKDEGEITLTMEIHTTEEVAGAEVCKTGGAWVTAAVIRLEKNQDGDLAWGQVPAISGTATVRLKFDGVASDSFPAHILPRLRGFTPQKGQPLLSFHAAM